MRRRRLTRREKRSKRKKTIIISTLCLLFVMTAGYAAFQTNLSITAKGNIKEPGRIIQSWRQYSNEDFHTDYYRENIVSATFLDNATVPSKATESWDISEDEKGGVKAWVVPNAEDSTKYDLYIGANGGVIANENSGYLFYNFQNIESINFNNNFDTSNTINMSWLFGNCTSLLALDLSSFDTSNVTNIACMFNMFDNSTQTVTTNKLSSIVFGDNWNVKNVTNMGQLFAGCYNLTTLDVSNWDTSNVVNMDSVFAYCRGLKEIDVSKWNTNKVQSMGWLFMSCANLETLDLSNFNTSNVKNMRCMFQDAKKLKNLDLCSFDTRNVTNMYAMFYGTTNLTQIKVGSNWTTANADTTNIFYESNISSVTTGQC